MQPCVRHKLMQRFRLSLQSHPPISPPARRLRNPSVPGAQLPTSSLSYRESAYFLQQGLDIDSGADEGVAECEGDEGEGDGGGEIGPSIFG